MAFLEVVREGHVATVTLSDPSKHNPMGPEFWDQMQPTMEGLGDDADVRAVVLLGEGKSFSSGLDLMAMMPNLPIDPGGGPPDGSRTAKFHRTIRKMQAAITSVARCRKPVIAAIAGYCLGGGIDLASACDIRLASRCAKFSIRETKIGIVADVGTLQRLPGIVGRGIARELVLTGRDFDVDYAERIGFVNRVLEDRDAVVAAASELAAEIAANPPLTVQGAKHVMVEAERTEIDRGLEYVATYNTAHLVTQDLGVAVTAAMTKQTPTFEGR